VLAWRQIIIVIAWKILRRRAHIHKKICTYRYVYNYWLEVFETSSRTHCSNWGIKDNIIILVRIIIIIIMLCMWIYIYIYILHCLWLDKFIDLRSKQQTRMVYSGLIDLCYSIIIILYFIDECIIVIHLIAMSGISKKKKNYT